jgi:hypothetical protein
VCEYGPAICTSGLGNEDIGWLYLFKDGSVRVWADLSISGYGCKYMGCLNLGQDRGMNIWAGCI